MIEDGLLGSGETSFFVTASAFGGEAEVVVANFGGGGRAGGGLLDDDLPDVFAALSSDSELVACVLGAGLGLAGLLFLSEETKGGELEGRGGFDASFFSTVPLSVSSLGSLILDGGFGRGGRCLLPWLLREPVLVLVISSCSVSKLCGASALTVVLFAGVGRSALLLGLDCIVAEVPAAVLLSPVVTNNDLGFDSSSEVFFWSARVVADGVFTSDCDRRFGLGSNAGLGLMAGFTGTTGA